jgi:hypothetical protein
LPLSASVTCSAQGGAPVVTVSGEPQAPYLGGNCSAPNTMSIMLMHDVNFTVKSTSLRRFGIANFTRRMARGEMAVIYAQDGDAICAGASHSTGFVRVGLAPATGWDAIVGAGNVSGLVEQECVDTACQLDFAAPQIVGGDDYILVVVQADDDGMVTIRADCDDRFSRPWTGGDSNTGLYIGLGVGFGWLCIICCIICLCKWCAARRAAKAIESDGGAPMESIHQPNEAYNGAPPYQDPNAHSLSMQTTLSHLPAQTAQQSQSHRVDGGQFQCHVCGNAYPTASDIAYHVQLRHQS